ncbi:MAG: hypothetical protein RL490_524 [Pseudomonadota bacterium]|jgi:transketolase N-terminal domain/subunit
MAAGGKLATAATIIPILAAMTANATMKVAMAATSGPLGYTLRIGGGIALSMAAAWGMALVG